MSPPADLRPREPFRGPSWELPGVEELVTALIAAGGGALGGVILFGSRLVGAAPGAHSAWDLVVVVDDYPSFHRALVGAGHHRRPPWLLNLLARVLPPSVTAFDPGGGAPLAKCAIVSRRALERALGPRSSDHFLKGRLVQQVEVAWARDEASAAALRESISGARRGVLGWVAPWLDETFAAPDLARRMLEVSYGGELRPESGDRVAQVYAAQKDFLDAAYAEVLAAAAADGAVVPVGQGRYRLAEPPGAWRRAALSLYFLRSKVRATARWMKHVLTFNDWLTYIQRKVERRTGMEIEITRWERRLPLLLLWPKVFRVLRRGRALAEPDAPPGEDGP